MTHLYKKKKLWIAILLSIIPGLSLLYLGRGKKTIALFIVDIGILLTLLLSTSYLAKLLAVNIYVFTFMVPFIESYQLARYGKNTVGTDSKWYVMVLLLTTGLNALPLLWQSGNFSHRAKILWSIAVPALAGIFVFALVNHWDAAENFLRNILRVNS
jgi:hypothetical protein